MLCTHFTFIFNLGFKNVSLLDEFIGNFFQYTLSAFAVASPVTSGLLFSIIT